MCAVPPYMDEISMRYPSLEDQLKDDESIYSWFRELIRVRSEYPAIARGVTEKADYLCDASVAGFFRRSETYGDLLIVMNTGAETAEKDLSRVIKGSKTKSKLKPVRMLTTGGESITYKKGTLTLPAYSIAVFKIS